MGFLFFIRNVKSKNSIFIKLIILSTKTRVMKNPLIENIKVERMSQKSLAIHTPF